MQESCVRLTLDVRETTSPAVVKAKQGDTGRKLLIHLSDGGVPYRIGDGCYAVFTAQKPDGNKIHNPCTIEKDEIAYGFTEQTCSCPGAAQAEIKLYGSDGKLLTSASFVIDVYEAVFSEGDAISSQGEMATLDALILETTALKKEVGEFLENLENSGSTGGSSSGSDDGGYYLPSVTQPDANTMTISFEASKQGMQTIQEQNITLPAGKEGEPGRGIVSITRTAGNGAAGTTDVYTITYTDGTASTFSVYNGANGKDGTGGSGGTGADGEDGEDGATFTPYVDSAGNLSWSNDKDLANPDTVNIKGPKGDTGATGSQGEKGDTGAIGPQGPAGADGAKGDTGPQGPQGETGADGKDGTSVTHSWSGTTLRVTSASGTSSANLKGDKGDKGDTGDIGPQGPQGETGPQGPQGDTGPQGPAGTNGTTPVKGVDYFTEADKAEMTAAVQAASKRKYGKLVVMGDSLGEGSNVPNYYSFVDALSDSGAFESVVKACKNSATIGPYEVGTIATGYDLCSQIERYAADIAEAEIVICEFGHNDLGAVLAGNVEMGSVSDSATETTVCGYTRKAINRILELNPYAKIHWVFLPCMDYQMLKDFWDDTDTADMALLFWATAMRVARDCGCFLVCPACHNPNLMSNDGMHPNREGQELLAETILQRLFTSEQITLLERPLTLNGDIAVTTDVSFDGSYATIYKLLCAGVHVPARVKNNGIDTVFNVSGYFSGMIAWNMLISATVTDNYLVSITLASDDTTTASIANLATNVPNAEGVSF